MTRKEKEEFAMYLNDIYVSAQHAKNYLENVLIPPEKYRYIEVSFPQKKYEEMHKKFTIEELEDICNFSGYLLDKIGDEYV